MLFPPNLCTTRRRDGTLEEADFSTCSIDPTRAQAIAEALKTNVKLVKLDLYDNQLGDDGLKALAGALETNTKLRVLNLKWNGLGKLNQVGGPDNDAGVIAFAAALKKNKTVEQINLVGCPAERPASRWKVPPVSFTVRLLSF